MQLADNQKRELEIVYYNVIDQEDEYGIAGGAHYLLLAELNKCKIYPGGTREAKRITESILFEN